MQVIRAIAPPACGTLKVIEQAFHARILPDRVSEGTGLETLPSDFAD
jgi:hypothetical protein